MGMGADDDIRFAFQEQLGPSLLGNVRLGGVFRSPVYEDQDEIGCSFCLTDIVFDFFFLLQQMDHMRAVGGERDAVCPVGVIEQGKTDAVFFQNFVRTVVFFVFALYAETGDAVGNEKFFGK